MTGKCKSCGASIVWLKTKAGKSIPVDQAEGIKAGDIFMVDSDKQMVSHFATCPNAAKHRKPRKGEVIIGAGTVVGPEETL